MGLCNTLDENISLFYLSLFCPFQAVFASFDTPADLISTAVLKNLFAPAGTNLR
jgi:hypothetical protein